MPHETELRLRSFLDTNQSAREGICLGLLAQDKRFTEVRPRHPKGGPDGGRDIDAVYRNQHVAAAGVGFVNGANDSSKQKREIKSKFRKDLASAKEADSRPEVFVFMTNLALTMGEQDQLRAEARKLGFIACEIFDREIMRTMLDSPDGLALRFQYLNLPLSEAEQASFFAKWGDGIQSLVTSSFQRVEQTLERLMFLQESRDVLGGISVHFELDQIYAGRDIGHFRAFVRMYLREPKHKIFQILFGSADRQTRFRVNGAGFANESPGIDNGVSGGAWEQHLDFETEGAEVAAEEADAASSEKWTQVYGSSSVGIQELSTVIIGYDHDSGLIRYQPRLKLKDLEDAGWVVLLDSRLSEKLSAIHIYANGYKLDEIRRQNLHFEEMARERASPLEFSDKELEIPWVIVRPDYGSFFQLRFSERTPSRFYTPTRTEPTMDYLRRRRAELLGLESQNESSPKTPRSVGG